MIGSNFGTKTKIAGAPVYFELIATTWHPSRYFDCVEWTRDYHCDLVETAVVEDAKNSPEMVGGFGFGFITARDVVVKDRKRISVFVESAM